MNRGAWRQQAKDYRGQMVGENVRWNRASRMAAARKKRDMVPVTNGYTRNTGYYGRFSGLNKEQKFFDRTFNLQTIDSTGENIGSINLVPQGVTESTRVGRKMVIRSIYIKGLVQWESEGMTGAEYALSSIRLCLVQDKQTNGTNASYNDVYENDNVLSFRNIANSSRFRILKTWFLIPSNPVLLTNIYCPPTYFTHYMKCNIPVDFDSTTGAITEIKNNNVFLCAESRSTNDDIHEADIFCRIRFDD